MHSNLVIAHTFASQVEAEIARSALEAAGIAAIIQADTAGGMRPHIAWAGSGFRILVREEDASAAHDFLEPPAEHSHWDLSDNAWSQNLIAALEKLVSTSSMQACEHFSSAE